jgi:hypothetical protein
VFDVYIGAQASKPDTGTATYPGSVAAVKLRIKQMRERTTERIAEFVDHARRREP